MRPDSTGLVQRLLKRCPDLGGAVRIVGIDLTGSEKRSTGWALMDGECATTKSIRTDDELIRETLAAKADIVSIDSPLSIQRDPAMPMSRSTGSASLR